MTEDQIKHMVNRFLMWRLPETFRPDHGISYTNPYPHIPSQPGPVGTNLFDAVQAEAMVRFMIDGMTAAVRPEEPMAWVRQSAIDSLTSDDTIGFEGVHTMLSAEKSKHCTIPIYVLPPETLCSDCPPVGYPTDKTRCSPCPRRNA